MTLPSYASEAYTRAAQEAVEPRELEARLLMKAARRSKRLSSSRFQVERCWTMDRAGCDHAGARPPKLSSKRRANCKSLSAFRPLENRMTPFTWSSRMALNSLFGARE